MLSEIVTSKQLDKMAATVGRGTEAGLCEQKIYFSLSSAGAILRDIEGLTSNLHYHHQLLTKGISRAAMTRNSKTHTHARAHKRARTHTHIHMHTNARPEITR